MDRAPKQCVIDKSKVGATHPRVPKVDDVVISDIVTKVINEELLPTLQEEKSCLELLNFLKKYAPDGTSCTTCSARNSCRCWILD